MSVFTCPKCALPLIEQGNTLTCSARHCFDLSSEGYVNLLLPGKGSRTNHGDDRLMVRARRAFLDGGYYKPLADAIVALALPLLPPSARLLDCGCGEGYYTAAIASALRLRDDESQVIGVDISKEAVRLAVKRDPALKAAVASVFHLPFADHFCDGILNLFAPMVPDEYTRVLKRGGFVLKATPLPEHLHELKTILYDTVYPTKPEPQEWEGLRTVRVEELRFPMEIVGKDTLLSLFEMTPYCYTTPREGRARLQALDALRISAAFRLVLYEAY